MSILTVTALAVAAAWLLSIGAAVVRRDAGWLMGHGGPAERQRVLQWLGAAAALAIGAAISLLGVRAMTGQPHHLDAWLIGLLAFIPAGRVLALLVRAKRAAAVAFVESVALAGLAALVCVVYLVIVVGIEGSPKGHERSILTASLVAAAVVALLVVPTRHRLVQFGDQAVGGREPSRSEVVSGFGARMTRSVPMDELMLQLVESLRDTIAPGGAEIWTGTEGLLTLAVSMPGRTAERISLGEHERVVIGRARIGGPAWTAVWLPGVHADAKGSVDHRAVPIAHLGELLGFIVVRRGPDGDPYDPDDESALVELARQLGLALHNVRLDSALQASLAELAERNEELQASRLRIVAAGDSSRRAIERNLHDGAQQHLVALAVKLGLTRQIAEEGDTESVLSLLEDLRGDVQTTITELRELAHGIYPPLLRDRGLNEALRAAASRMSLPCSVSVELPGRYPEDAETAAYFCCLEAMQNAGKYAGDGASVFVEVAGDEQTLRFELRDDGAGFDMTSTELGHGFMNMNDRLGAIGGTLAVESSPGAGTSVRATIPAQPLSDDSQPGGTRTAVRSPA